MGVSGSGKTLIGKKLSKILNCEFIEGDDYHSSSNKEKMAKGDPLTDADRLDWLNELRDHLSQASKRIVLSCSSLKKSYREILSAHSNRTVFIHLHAYPEILEHRLNARKNHFFNPSLLLDQLNTLEALNEDETGFQINTDNSCENIVAEIKSKLNDMNY